MEKVVLLAKRLSEKRARKKEKGFTLLELLIVLIVIGTLAAAAISKMSGTDEGAIISTMKQDARTAISVMNSYYLQYRQYTNATADANGSKDAVRAQLNDPDGQPTTYYLVASPGNTVTVTAQNCADGTLGFSLSVTGSGTSKTISYDSCTDAGIKEN